MKHMVITFEGNEGSGKTTAVKKISEYLTKQGIKNCILREPGGNKIAEEIRSVIVDKTNNSMDGMTEMLLYLAARRQNLVESIIPATKEYDIVLIDRFYDSTYAYQVFGRGMNKKFCDILHDYVLEDFKVDKTFYFKIEPVVGQERIHKNNRSTNRMDEQSMEFYNKVNEGYEARIRENPERFVVIDASFDEKTVFENCISELKKLGI